MDFYFFFARFIAFNIIVASFKFLQLTNKCIIARLLFPFIRDSRNWPWSVHAVGPGEFSIPLSQNLIFLGSLVA